MNFIVIFGYELFINSLKVFRVSVKLSVFRQCGIHQQHAVKIQAVSNQMIKSFFKRVCNIYHSISWFSSRIFSAYRFLNRQQGITSLHSPFTSYFLLLKHSPIKLKFFTLTCQMKKYNEKVYHDNYFISILNINKINKRAVLFFRTARTQRVFQMPTILPEIYLLYGADISSLMKHRWSLYCHLR